MLAAPDAKRDRMIRRIIDNISNAKQMAWAADQSYQVAPVSEHTAPNSSTRISNFKRFTEAAYKE
jgi:hypothetical protein